ncbi:WYL domain-containing protein [Polaribacter sp. R2A056_3_33]|uniref:helix-turn-helix transcriptional regulator n=1 Tax=Polaribacter sp. R2A056_3_33 TaxID=2745563 RepID=UPI001C4F3095|nr:WYL domain-containing protein [Polaribacter sp. R2A056_3_33]QXP70774.1 WYL domain-containing protein [Polaribacter sp. R2A056_3_33]
MSKNKNFQKRITVLDECFASRTGAYTLDRLKEVVEERLELSVSRKTIQNDIKYIRETIENNQSKNIDFSDNPVFFSRLFDGKKTVFKYVNENLALGNQLLSKSDQEQLEETLAILSRYRNRADFFWLDELFPRIEASFNIVHEDYNGLISYQSNRDYSGQSWVGKLYNQLLRKKVLIIEYKGFKDVESYLRKIHPYHLKQYNDRWFLLALEKSEKYTGITNLALDRIIAITETIEEIEPNQTNWGDFFDEMIGVSRSVNEEPIEVKLRFSVKRIPYVLTKPIHGASQRLDVTDPEKRTIILNLFPNKELYQTLLSFGQDLQVLEPKVVVEELKKITSEMKNIYS